MGGTEVLLTYKRKRFRSARCSIDSASGLVNHQGESAEGNNIDSCTDVSQPAPEEKRLCPDIVKPLSSPKASREEDKGNHVHGSDCFTFDPSKVVLDEGKSKKASCNPISLHDYSESLQKSDKTCSDGTTDVTFDDMLVDVIPQKELITFRRRSKQKKQSETLENDSTLVVTTAGDGKTTATLIACEATASKSGSAIALENPSPLKTSLINEPAFTLSQEKKATGEDDSSCSTFENGSSKPVYGTLGNTSGTGGQSHGAGSCSTFENGSSKPVYGTLENTSGTGGQSHSQDSGFAFSSLQAKNSVDFQETPSVEKSPVLSNDNTNRLEKADVILSSKSAETSLDLSIHPPAKVDSKKALEQELHGQPIIGSLLPSINGNLNSPILEVPIKDRDLKLLQEKPENRNPSFTHQPANHCSSAETIVEMNNQVNFAPALDHPYLQLFPENVSEQRNYWQETRVNSVSEERPINLHQIRTQAKTATPISSCYLGLPSESRLKNFARSSKLEYFPDQSPPSFTRHQMIIDKIASRSSIPLKGITSNNTPAPWSEEELDCLWIGVRRYGRGNWDAMLRDPRLQFLPWRGPTELAFQWEMEQHKHLNRIIFPNHPRHFKKPPNVVNDYSLDGVQLSLGYSRRILESSVALANNNNNNNQRRAFMEIHAAQCVNNSFPHWLKVPPGVPPRTNDTSSLHLVTSTINPVVSDQPNNTIIKEEVIIINSDVSSEGTISDDQNGRS